MWLQKRKWRRWPTSLLSAPIRYLSQLHWNVLLNRVRPFSSFRFDLCFINIIHSDAKFQVAGYRILYLYMPIYSLPLKRLPVNCLGGPGADEAFPSPPSPPSPPPPPHPHPFFLCGSDFPLSHSWCVKTSLRCWNSSKQEHTHSSLQSFNLISLKMAPNNAVQPSPPDVGSGRVERHTFFKPCLCLCVLPFEWTCVSFTSCLISPSHVKHFELPRCRKVHYKLIWLHFFIYTSMYFSKMCFRQKSKGNFLLASLIAGHCFYLLYWFRLWTHWKPEFLLWCLVYLWSRFMKPCYLHKYSGKMEYFQLHRDIFNNICL